MLNTLDKSLDGVMLPKLFIFYFNYLKFIIMANKDIKAKEKGKKPQNKENKKVSAYQLEQQTAKLNKRKKK